MRHFLTQAIFSSFFLIFIFSGRLYAQEVEWVKTIGGLGNEFPKSLCSDKYGNAYISYQKDSSLYVRKVNDHSGEILWEFSEVYGSNHDFASLLLCDSEENLIMHSYFGLSKYSGANGTILWKKFIPFGSTVVDKFGNIYCIYTTSSTLQKKSDIILNKINGKNGDVLFEKLFGGIYRDHAGDLVIDKEGSLYFIGTFEYKTVLGTYSVSNAFGQRNNSSYICKLNSDGYVQYLIPGINSDFSNLSFDDSGNLYASGYTSSVTTIGNGVNSKTLTPNFLAQVLFLRQMPRVVL